MKVLQYWLARLGLFALVVLVLWYVVGWRDILSVIAALILAWLIAYLLLPHLRADAAVQMDGWINRSEKSIREADAEEDAEIGATDEPDGKN